MDIKTLAASQKARLAGERERNRRDFPFIEPWKEELERAFGPVRVTYATNGTREVGERFEDRCKREGHTPCRYLRDGVGR